LNVRSKKFCLFVVEWLDTACFPGRQAQCRIAIRKRLEGANRVRTRKDRGDVREATEQELDRITALYAQDPYLFQLIAPREANERDALEQYRERMREGDKCFVALVGSEIVHVNWLCFKWGGGIPGHPFNLRPDEVYTIDGFTVEGFRRRNVHTVVLGEMLGYAQRAGYRTAYTVPRADRSGAFNAFRQLGWRRIGRFFSFTPRWTDKSWIVCIRGGTLAFRD
jgi:GNAT superfamily N-acetyltransferase